MEYSNEGLKKKNEELNHRLVQACNSFEVAHELIQRLERENANLRQQNTNLKAALSFCKECMHQYIDVNHWVDRLEKMERGEHHDG